MALAGLGAPNPTENVFPLWRQPNFNGGNKDLVVKVCNIAAGEEGVTPDTASILIYLDDGAAYNNGEMCPGEVGCISDAQCDDGTATTSTPTCTSPSKAPSHQVRVPRTLIIVLFVNFFTHICEIIVCQYTQPTSYPTSNPSSVPTSQLTNTPTAQPTNEVCPWMYPNSSSYERGVLLFCYTFSSKHVLSSLHFTFQPTTSKPTVSPSLSPITPEVTSSPSISPVTSEPTN